MATRRSARLRLEALTRIKTSFGFGVGIGRSRTSTPFSPSTAACMIDPPGAFLLDRVVSLKPCRFQPSDRAARERLTDEPAYPPEKNRRLGLPTRLPLDLCAGSR